MNKESNKMLKIRANLAKQTLPKLSHAFKHTTILKHTSTLQPLRQANPQEWKLHAHSKSPTTTLEIRRCWSKQGHDVRWCESAGYESENRSSHNWKTKISFYNFCRKRKVGCARNPSGGSCVNKLPTTGSPTSIIFFFPFFFFLFLNSATHFLSLVFSFPS